MGYETSALSRRHLLASGGVLLFSGLASTAVARATEGSRHPVGEAPIHSEGRLSKVTIAPQSGAGVVLKAGESIRVESPEGAQVADLFAFVLNQPDEYLCPRMTMTRQRRLYPRLGEPFYSNRRRPLLLLEEDTVGVHDLLYPACDSRLFGARGLSDHPSCRGNLNQVLEEIGFKAGGHAEPHNLFQNSPVVDMEGNMEVRESPAKPGDHVLLKALDDLLVVVTACSVTGVLNGHRPKPIELEVLT